MMKMKRRKSIIYCCAAVGLVIVIILAAEGINSLTRNKVDTSEGLELNKTGSPQRM